MNVPLAVEDKRQTDLFGMWVFIAMETLFFGGAFFLYWSTRHQNPEAFVVGSRRLVLNLAAINTGILLTSSFTMACAVEFLKTQTLKRARLALFATGALGSIFLVIKVYEYFLDAKQGIQPFFSSALAQSGAKELQLFYSLYFLLTGLHAIHLTIGIVWCAVVRRRPLPTRVAVLGLYWHFVDIVWICLLPLLYMVGGAR